MFGYGNDLISKYLIYIYIYIYIKSKIAQDGRNYQNQIDGGLNRTGISSLPRYYGFFYFLQGRATGMFVERPVFLEEA